MSRNALKPAVFLDRDGVINRTTVRGDTPYPPQSPGEVEILPGVPEAVERLAKLGLPLIVVTNQPDVARKTQTREAVDAINRLILDRLPQLSAVYVCCHDTPDNCDCRKPKPGMLLRAAQEHGIDLAKSFMVGDRSGDVLAGAAAGCRTFLIDLPYSKGDRCSPDYRVADLLEAAAVIEGLMT